MKDLKKYQFTIMNKPRCWFCHGTLDKFGQCMDCGAQN